MNWLTEMLLDALFLEAWHIDRDPASSWTARSAARMYMRARRPNCRLT